MTLQIELLEKSFQLVAPKGDALVTRFYERLFQKYPVCRAALVSQCEYDPAKEEIAGVPGAGDSKSPEAGGAETGFDGDGALPEHYPAVAENFLAVLAGFAGTAWTPPVQQAWKEALDVINTIMLEGAKQHSVSSVAIRRTSRKHINNFYGRGAGSPGDTFKGEQTMKRGFAIFSKWGIAAKLLAVFAIFGLLPMTVVGWIAFSAADNMKEKIGLQFSSEAQNLANQIDRNLSERYGDMQAFGYNDAITRTS